VGAGTRAWWDETRSRVGLGPYSYPVAAFEDYKAVGIGSPIKAEPATSAHAPRLVYDEIDYSKNHPQPTPSFRTAKDEPDIFAPSSPEYRAPDSLAVSVKRQPSDQGQWDSGSGADVKDKGEKA
jgi:hypothetical protein